MFNDRKLLVVDDEPVICEACRRVFSRHGFQVEESTDTRQGLSRAKEMDYAAILLDIKMSEIDGIQFLEELRKKKPDVPVMIMTGYPSIPNAAAAVRLGASDYITKPFTPEEITQSVQRMLTRRDAGVKGPSGSVAPAVESWAKEEGEFLFLEESWLQLEEDGSACVGSVLAHRQDATVEAVRLPQVGEVVYQGLPLAEVTMTEGAEVVVPSPISGVVVGVNELLRDTPSAVFDDPCGKGWLACICTTRPEEEVKRCKPRCVVLAGADEASSADRRRQLTLLGCRVCVAKNWNELAAVVRDPEGLVLVFDAASFGKEGPELVGRVRDVAPSAKVLVVASSASQWEAAYREHRIFYYAVEPFADGEIIEILDAAFRRQRRPRTQAPRRKALSEPIHGIRITNRNGHKVQLLAAPGLLRRDEGLGGQMREKLITLGFPMVTTPGNADVSPDHVLKTAGNWHRVMVLLAKDTGRG